MKSERRDFLKITTAGAAGLALLRTTPARAEWPSTGTMEINPDISNMRVVACVDAAMIKSVPTSMTFETQNAAIDAARVQSNLDAMAMALSQKSTADEAWKTIFRSSKEWSSTVVAVKVNGGEAKNTAHLAVLQKLSSLFVGWGVKPQNFIVYDGHTMGTTGIFKASFSTTDKSKVLGVMGGTSGSAEDLLGGWKDAKLVDGTTRRCAAKIVDGTVDILINIANNKGHAYGTALGNVTLCMKNHYGTWEPDQTHTDLANLIFKMNKSDPIIGGTPPRQQLCIVDSLFCNKSDITGTPELMPGYLVMGTFAPAVDYQTVKKIRVGVSGLKHDDAKIAPYLTSFGYKTSDVEWILVPAGGGAADAGVSGSGGAATGGASGAGGSGGSVGNTGGTRGSGGVRGSGGENASGTGGAHASGGNRGVGGASTASGGGIGAGGQSGSGGGTARVDSTGAGLGGAASGSSESGPGTSGNGCGCTLGGRGARGLGVTIVAGAVLARQLRRLLLGRDNQNETKE